MQGTKLTIKDKSVSPAKLANFLKPYISHSFGDYSVRHYLKVAKEIIDGKEYISDLDLKIPENEFINIELFDLFPFKHTVRDYYNDLMEKGANGDAQAAIEFCQALRDGKHNMMPYA